jgi:transposase-like protein
VQVRSCRYLNNIVEQDHRAIKHRCASMLGFKSIKTAAINSPASSSLTEFTSDSSRSAAPNCAAVHR